VTLRDDRGRILVPVSPEREAELALGVVGALTRSMPVHVELVAVERGGRGPEEIDELLRRSAEQLPVDADVSTRDLGRGEPTRMLVEELRADPPDLVAMATRALGPVGEWILGSVADEVVRWSPAPVLLVGPGVVSVPDRYVRVLAAVDGSDLAAAAAGVGARLAARIGARLDLVEVLDASDPPPPPDVLETAYLGRLAASLDPRPRDYDVLHDDDPAEAIAGSLQGDDTIVVLGTHGRGGLERILMGSVAFALVRDARCPVLVVPPRAIDGDGGTRGRSTSLVS
jgi:nucleotide-binding universal stress UspA family protein